MITRPLNRSTTLLVISVLISLLLLFVGIQLSEELVSPDTQTCNGTVEASVGSTRFLVPVAYTGYCRGDHPRDLGEVPGIALQALLPTLAPVQPSKRNEYLKMTNDNGLIRIRIEPIVGFVSEKDVIRRLNLESSAGTLFENTENEIDYYRSGEVYFSEYMISNVSNDHILFSCTSKKDDFPLHSCSRKFKFNDDISVYYIFPRIHLNAWRKNHKNIVQLIESFVGEQDNALR